MSLLQKPLVSSFASAASREPPKFESGAGRLNLFSADGADAADMDMARFIMALRARGLRDTALLAAFECVPRRAFFAEALWPHLHADIALPLPFGEEATSPHRIAQMLNAAELRAGMRVLEIGTGSGYQTALITLIAGQVTSLERSRMLAMRARRVLSALKVGPVDIRLGDGLAEGDWPEGRFDRIIVNGVVEAGPRFWLDRLAPRGAILFAASGNRVAILTRRTSEEATVVDTEIGPSSLPRLKPGRARVL